MHRTICVRVREEHHEETEIFIHTMKVNGHQLQLWSPLTFIVQKKKFKLGIYNLFEPYQMLGDIIIFFFFI